MTYWRSILLAGAVGLGAGFYSYKHEINKDKLIPLAFSEISQIERQAEEQGTSTPKITSYLAKTNDLTMKVFEAWNESWGTTTGILSDQTDAFIYELNKKVDPIYKEHKYEIPHLSVKIPAEADSVLKVLEDFKDLKNNLSIVKTYLDKTWDDNHHDSYHTEIYYTTSTHTDANGNTYTTTDMHTRSVYDYTDNTYIYHKNTGDKSSQLMDDAKDNFNNIRLKESFMIAKELGNENIDAIYKSRKELVEEGKKLSPQELKNISSMWLYGSTIYNNSINIYSLWDKFKREADEWRKAKNNARSYSKRTYNYSHAESYEFLVTENALKTTSDIIPLLENGLESVHYTKNKVPELYSKIKKIIDNKDNENFDKKKAKKEIMALSKDIYKTNFNKGFDVEPAEYGWVALFSFLGLLIGGGAGYGLDYFSAIRNYRSYRS